MLYDSVNKLELSMLIISGNFQYLNGLKNDASLHSQDDRLSNSILNSHVPCHHYIFQEVTFSRTTEHMTINF